MKRLMCILTICFFVFGLFPQSAALQTGDEAFVPSKYDEDAFCFSFETESDFNDENLPIASSYDNQAVGKQYSPGAGGSSAALHVRTESAVTVNGNVNNGVKNLRLTPGQVYHLSVWIKLLANDIYRVAPNLNFFIMNDGTPLYEDEACTIPAETVSGFYNLIKITGTDIGFRNEDGTISGDWKSAETTFTMPFRLGNYFVDKNKPVSCSMFLRIGSNEHTIKTISDYTDEFIASITDDDGTVNPNGFYCDYALDDWSLTPFEEKSGTVTDVSIVNDFESSSWTTASGVRWTHTASKAELECFSDDTRNNSHALKLTYTGSPNGYMELSAHLDNNTSIIHNRAYKISFRAKASDALVNYFAEKAFYFKMIPERASENRLERTKHKWAETLIRKKLSDGFEHFEILWYEPNENMLGRDTENDTSVRLDFRVAGVPSATALKTETVDGNEISYVYSYEDKLGHTVYAGFEDFRVWFDDVCIEPLDIVYNGDMSIGSPQDVKTLSAWDSTCFAPGENNRISDIFGVGEIVADETFSAVSGIPCGNVLKLTEEDGAPSQNVEVLNQTDYKISFWAKAGSPEEVGRIVSPVFDRSIIGSVRNSDVTAINPDGRLGYGNPTDEIGDIPYYMYRGTQYTHQYTELTVNDGEAPVYDDYFARMKSVDAYKDQEEPTAWNYQFYNGENWVSTNRNEVPQSNESWRLTGEWKQYECFYRWDYEGSHYRMPKFKIMTDEPTSFCLADIKIQRMNKTEDEIKIKNVRFEDSVSRLYVNNDMHIQYDFQAADETIKEGKSVLKFLAGDENGNYAVVGMTYCSADRQTKWKISKKLLGRRPGIEIIPISTAGRVGVISRIECKQVVAGKVIPSVTVNGSEATYRIESIFAPNFPQKNIEAYLAFYSWENRLLKITRISVPVRTETNVLCGTVPMGEAAKVKLFTFENTIAVRPCYDGKTAFSFPKNNAPFEGNEQITVAYLGGSAMSGKGLYAPEASSYTAYISEYFKDTYGDKAMCFLNLAKDGSTISEGLSQAERAAERQPDVVFVDFSVDDGGKDVRNELCEMIATLCGGEKIPYIIFLYSADRDYSNLSEYYSQVAEKFQIPQIDLSEALRTHLDGDDAMSEGYLYDTVHPTEEGHIVYAEAIMCALKTGQYYSRPSLKR